MKNFWKLIVFVGSPLLALIAFMANQSASEMQSNLTSYATNPLVRSLPNWLFRIMQTDWFLAVAFFVLGCVATVFVRRWLAKRGRLSPFEALTNDVSLAAYSLDNSSSMFTNPAVIANLNVVMNKLHRHGFATPPANNGGFAKEKISYYLHQVAAYMKEDGIASAKRSAQSIVDGWNK
ncbi:hypothetical protein Q4610_05565 [Sphingobium sp. HBC34]|uniref:DUF4129 domain-containing protein n=1 Tax=Sphingobium cyanobacteriorum TaxID=3063954 RepID=A0ABT8ZJ04_9SPHN|nr:hypothetical protein [Sphingobium sp. HBC34]MDO7834509.1 hypothetical protein [Sphingobium sp. HBC34]